MPEQLGLSRATISMTTSYFNIPAIRAANATTVGHLILIATTRTSVYQPASNR